MKDLVAARKAKDRAQAEYNAALRATLIATVKRLGTLAAAAEALDLSESQARRLWTQLDCAKDCPLHQGLGTARPATPEERRAKHAAVMRRARARAAKNA